MAKTRSQSPEPGAALLERSQAPYQPPTHEVISLSCEITAYAPDDEPLF